MPVQFGLALKFSHVLDQRIPSIGEFPLPVVAGGWSHKDI